MAVSKTPWLYTHHLWKPEGKVMRSTACWTSESREVAGKCIWENFIQCQRQVLFPWINLIFPLYAWCVGEQSWYLLRNRALRPVFTCSLLCPVCVEHVYYPGYWVLPLWVTVGEAYIGENVCLFSIISIAEWLEPCASLQLMVSAFNPRVYKYYHVFVWCVFRLQSTFRSILFQLVVPTSSFTCIR